MTSRAAERGDARGLPRHSRRAWIASRLDLEASAGFARCGSVLERWPVGSGRLSGPYFLFLSHRSRETAPEACSRVVILGAAATSTPRASCPAPRHSCSAEQLPSVPAALPNGGGARPEDRLSVRGARASYRRQRPSDRRGLKGRPSLENSAHLRHLILARARLRTSGSGIAEHDQMKSRGGWRSPTPFSTFSAPPGRRRAGAPPG
jgi:hypothetical protein